MKTLDLLLSLTNDITIATKSEHMIKFSSIHDGKPTDSVAAVVTVARLG